MSTNLSKQSDLSTQYNPVNFRAVHNDGHIPLGQVENIIITVDSNTEFTIKAGTQFYRYDTETFTTPATPATGNGSYPNSTALTYYSPDAIFETADRQVVIGVTSGFSSANGTYYIYCSGSDDSGVSTKGNGVYDANTTAPVWNETKNGWYNSTEKCIGRYVVTSAVISEFAIFQGRCKKRGYIEHGGITVSGVDVTIKKLHCDIDGALIQYLQDVTVTTSTTTTWRYLHILSSVSPGKIEIISQAGFSLVGSSWSPSGNQLDMYTLYSESDNHYCEIPRTSGNGQARILATLQSIGGSGQQIIPIDNRPKSYVYAQSDTSQLITTGQNILFKYEDINVDVNSDVDLSSSWTYTPKVNCIANINHHNISTDPSGVLINDFYYSQIYDATTLERTLTRLVTFASQSDLSWFGGITLNLLTTGAYNIRLRQDTPNNCNTFASGTWNWITIREV